MTRSTSFITTYVAVVIGTFMLVMTVAFLSVPYAMKAHPGEPMGKVPAASSYHLT